MDKLINLYKNNKATFIYLVSTFIISYFFIYWIFYASFSEAIGVWIIISIYFYPILYIAKDTRISKEQKVGWFIFVFFLSYLGFAFYLIKKKD